MKKILLFICAFIPAFAFAQPGPLDINLGLKAGLNFARMGGNTWTGGYRSGVLGGVFGSVGTKKVAAQVEILFATTSMTGKGSTFHQANPSLLLNKSDSSGTGSFSASYLQIPILLNLKMFGNATIQIGPQYTSVLSINDKDKLLNVPTDRVFNNSDFGGVVGIQLKLPLKLNAGVRYVFGFSDQGNSSLIKESWRQNSIQAHIGFSFL